MKLYPRLALLVAGVLASALVSACSLPAEDRVTQIKPDELGPELVDPTTTTTTTTLPPTSIPTSTDPSASQPTTSTTVAEVTTERQRIYYTIGSSEDLQRVTIPLPEGVSYAAMRSELESPRPEVRELGLRTAVRPGLIESFSFDQTTVTLTVSLDATVFGEQMTEIQRRTAIAQIVLTFTSFAPADTGAIGFVNFAIDDAPISVVIPRTGGSSTAGQPLNFADFQTVLGQTPGGEPPATTEPTLPPATTPPATVPPATTTP